MPRRGYTTQPRGFNPGTGLAVERGSCGPKGLAPKGLKNLAQGLPWVFGLMPEALKGRPVTRRRGTYPEIADGPFRAPTLGCISQGKPWEPVGFEAEPKGS